MQVIAGRHSHAVRTVCGLLGLIVFSACGGGESTRPKPPVTVNDVTPDAGPLGGGTTITVSGTNFINVTSVSLGGTALLELNVVSDTQLTGRTPTAAASGPIDVIVTTSGNGADTCTGCFTYNPAMSVTAVAPATGVLTGGTEVTITGTNFANVTGVTIGGAALYNMIVVSPTSITGMTTEGPSAGARDVRVTSSSHGVASCVGCFSYNPATTISNVAPISGPVTGGTAITITGANFVGVTAVTVGGTPLVNTNVVSSTQITGLTPAGPNNGTIVVTTAVHGTGTCTGCFTYDPPISITSVSPASGRLSGNTPIIITGSSFHNVTAVTIGGVAMQNVVVVSSTQIQGGTPAGTSADSRDVIVSSSTHGTATCTGCYTFEPPLTWAMIAVGTDHSCGLTTGGAAYCWGDGRYGALGNGERAIDSWPRPVRGGLVFDTIAAGSDHTCGLTRSGAAYCWGGNTYGALGDGSTTHRDVPVPVAGGLTFSSLSLGGSSSCGLTPAGAAYCWGSNVAGALGDNSNTQRNSPVAVSGGLTFAALDHAGGHTCAITAAGDAYCWGYNGVRQLGGASSLGTSSYVPVPVTGGLSFTRISAGGSHSCGVVADGATYCWGGNGNGELGDGSYTYRSTPVLVSGGLTFKDLIASLGYTCGVVATGMVYCWGRDFTSLIGDNTKNRTTPGLISGGLNFRIIDPGGTHTCGVTTEAVAYCWGYNASGQLGDGTRTDRSVPVAVTQR